MGLHLFQMSVRSIADTVVLCVLHVLGLIFLNKFVSSLLLFPCEVIQMRTVNQSNNRSLL